MADILIRGMEMPATCWNCKLKVGFSACGLVTDHKDGGLFYRVHNGNSRPDWCPLLPLPAGHGRMIDADELMNRARECLDELTILSLEFLVNGSSTIVPAEGGIKI